MFLFLERRKGNIPKAMNNSLIRKDTFSRNDVVIEMTRNINEICLVLELTINGKTANIYDFGITKDLAPSKASAYGCGNRVFVPSYLSPIILKRYGLTPQQGKDVVYILTKVLHIGCCKKCK